MKALLIIYMIISLCFYQSNSTEIRHLTDRNNTNKIDVIAKIKSKAGFVYSVERPFDVPQTNKKLSYNHLKSMEDSAFNTATKNLTKEGVKAIFSKYIPKEEIEKIKGKRVAVIITIEKNTSLIKYQTTAFPTDIPLTEQECNQIFYDIDLQILDRNMEWTVEPGEFEIMAGSSSTDIRLSQTVELE